MSTLREAAEKALEVLEHAWIECDYQGNPINECDKNVVKAANALRSALAEPEQEPVAWRTFDGEGGYDYRTYEDNENYRDEWEKHNPNHKGWVEPLYTHPAPQRAPLTDEQILLDEVLRYNFGCNGGAGPVSQKGIKIVRAIERAHGIGSEA